MCRQKGAGYIYIGWRLVYMYSWSVGGYGYDMDSWRVYMYRKMVWEMGRKEDGR